MIEAEQIFQQRYQLKQKLAQNAGRQTWLAQDISIQPAETVILKFLSFGEQFQWQDLKLFEREADILKQLSHPRIPKYRDYFAIEDKNNWFALVQEYIPGNSLKQLVESQQRFSESELRRIAAEVLDILCYLHTLNPQVIHRDIKPSNLILGEDKRVYLIDFGAVQDNATAQGTTFTVVGTYGYAPVEQFGGRTVPASDLYALGATLIHLATGTIPADLPQKNMRIQFQDKVSLTDNFVRWIEKLIEPDIEKRFSKASQVLEALNNHLGVNSFSQITKSYGTPIKLNKSDDYLEIEIPPRGFNIDNAFLILIGVVWFSLLSAIAIPLLSILFGILALYVFNSLLFANYGTCYIKITQKDFIIKWKIFSFTYEQAAKTSTINYVGDSHTYYRINDKSIRTISIESGAKKYNFGAFISDVERKWLVEEIRDWLDI